MNQTLSTLADRFAAAAALQDPSLLTRVPAPPRPSASATSARCPAR